MLKSRTMSLDYVSKGVPGMPIFPNVSEYYWQFGSLLLHSNKQ